MSLSIDGQISPVDAPYSSQYASCAPSNTLDPAITLLTRSRYTNGGAMPTSTPCGAPAAIALARSMAAALVVFIFQLPATNGVRIIILSKTNQFKPPRHEEHQV